MTKDQINRLIHAYVEPEGCWHEWKYTNDGHCSFFECVCKKRNFVCAPNNPDYSLPDHWTKLKDKLFEDERMWKAFCARGYTICQKDGFPRVDYFIEWLFFDYAHFCTLFVKFLCLDETREEFGWMECPHYPVECDGRYKGNGTYEWCESCNGSGQILRPWAKLVEEGK